MKKKNQIKKKEIYAVSKKNGKNLKTDSVTSSYKDMISGKSL